jgi:hypothetical protein
MSAKVGLGRNSTAARGSFTATQSASIYNTPKALSAIRISVPQKMGSRVSACGSLKNALILALSAMMNAIQDNTVAMNYDQEP